MKKILTFAHRGASAYLAENTIAAFEQAITLGADGIELDIQLTKDGDIVVFHDAGFPDGPIIADLTAAQIIAEGERLGIEIPLLDTVLSRIHDRAVLDIEIKSSGLAEALITKLSAANSRKIICTSFIQSAIVELKKKAPELVCGIVTNTRLADPVRMLEACGADVIVQRFDLLDNEYVRILHEGNKTVFAWTVNDSTDIRRVCGDGVDGVISDYPDRVIACMRKGRYPR
ncbi:MAG: glycerophosphodiester phosphodiesterase [Candidatus Omnitrophica bacterium]|nr:glycerophosphodiester phosphodiesterase [Candidatus Omnitrophota bacterium]